jgi:TP901 family phage tail tape measure protein
MAKAFNLTAQINLAGPNNIKPVVSKIKKELGAIKVDVKVNIDPRAAKSIDSVKNKLLAMNSVLGSAKNNANELNAALRSLSAGLTAVKGGGGQASASMASVAKSAVATSKNLKTASNQMEEFGKQSYLAIKRFAAFGIAAGGIYRLVNAVTSGFKAFIEFDRELVRLQQVTGDGSVAIQALSKQITGLATTLGVSSEKLTEVAVTLAQAGLSAKETEQALSALAKTELAPSFDNLTDTTEGAIAAMRQFGIQTKDLESALGSINAVAAGFAVESSDIIVAIQRAGGAFAASSTGVSEGTKALSEFIAVFTSVRATTRESAETIATGLRTIFTRVQRPQTIEFLRQFGVELTDLEGKFVGPYEAIKRLSGVLSKLDPRDLRFAQIVEELGGFRQISKVIPLIQQFAEAEKALKTAQQGQGSLTKAQEVAQKSLAVQLAKVREEFLALIKTVGQSDTFQGFFKVVLSLSSALIKLAGAFRPILPALAILGTIKGAKAATQFAGGFLGSFKKGGGSKSFGTTLGNTITGALEKERKDETNKASEGLKENTSALTTLTKAIVDLTTAINNKGGAGGTFNKGGKVLGFARGGPVPGSGNGDTVPAMLQPGEFVLRKKAVQTIGTDQLHQYNQNKYAGGGKILGARSKVKELDSSELAQLSTDQLIAYAKKQAHDIFSTGGAGMATGHEFIEVPKERIIPELDSDLVNYMGKRGFWKETIARFGSPKKLSKKQTSRLGKEDALKAQMDRQSDEVAAREQQWKNIRSGSVIDNYLLKSLQEPILSDYKNVRGGGTLGKAFHNTRLRKAVNEALESYDDFDYSGGNLDKLISNFAAKKFANGGLVQKFVDGGSVEDAVKKNVKGKNNTYQFGIAALKSGTSAGSRYESFPLSKDDPNSPMIGLHIGTLGDAIGNQKIAGDIEENLTSKLKDSIISTASSIAKNIPGTKLVGSDLQDKILDGSVLSSAVGNVFESALNMLGSPFLNKVEKAKSIDFPLGLGPLASSFFGDPDLANIPTDATRTFGGSGKGISDFKGQIGRFLGSVKNNEFTKAGVSLGPEKTQAEVLSAQEYIEKLYKNNANSSDRLTEINKIFRQYQVGGGFSIKVGPSGDKQSQKKFKDLSEALLKNSGLKTALDPFQGKGEQFASGGSTKDTVPALLTPGEFVVNEKAAKRIGYGKLHRMNKADKIQGYNKGGVVGGIQRFAGGGTVLPSSDPRVIAVFEDAAKRAGLSLVAFEKQLKEEIKVKALVISKERKETRANIKTNIVGAAAKGLGDRASRKEFATSLSAKIKSLNPNAKDSDVNKAVGEIVKGIKSGKSFDDMLKSSTASLKPLKDALDGITDNSEALKQAQDDLATQFGGLTEAVKVTIGQLNAAEYKESGQASKDFGILGDLAPEIALGFKQSGIGEKLLSSANKFQNLGIGGLDAALGKLPGIVGDAVKAVGGLPGVLAGAGSILADTLKNNDVFGSSVRGAGLVGALGGAGSSAISLGTLGNSLAGPIGGMIGTIGGALSGAIEGFLEGSKIQELENSMFALNDAADKANKALDNLGKVDNASNYSNALKRVDSLRDNINDLGVQAQSTLGEKSATGASGAIIGGTVGGAVGLGALGLAGSAAAASAAGGAAAAAATVSGLTAIGGAVAGLAAVVGTGGLIAIPAILGAVGYGLYRFSQGTKELDKQALEGQLKGIESYVKGITQLTERKIKLSSVRDIEKGIKDYENATTLAQKRLVGQNSTILDEAGRGAQERGVSVASAKREASIALAMQELNQIYAGNTDAIRRESKDKEKLYERGLILAAEQTHQIRLQERMAIAMKDVNIQSESLIELFNKMSASVDKFSSDMDIFQEQVDNAADALIGEGKIPKPNRRDENIIKNSTAYSDSDFNAVLSRVSQLSGGGENADRLTGALKGKRIVENELPGLLRGTSKNDIKGVEKSLSDLFDRAGIGGEAKNSVLKQIVDQISEETTGRQGKSYKELEEEFDALQQTMTTLNTASETASNILQANNDQMARYSANLEKITQGQQRLFELETKADQIRLDTAMKIDEVFGRSSASTSADAKDKEIRRLSQEGGAKGSLDARAIGDIFRKINSDFIENNKTLQNDPNNTTLLQKQKELAYQSGKLKEALEALADNTEHTAKIMDDFSRSQNLGNNVKDILKNIYTNGPEENFQMQQQFVAGQNLINNPSMIGQMPVEDRRNAISGLDIFKQLGLVTPEQESKIFLESLPEEMRKSVIGMVGDQKKTFEDLFKTDSQKTVEALSKAEIARNEAISQLKISNRANVEEYKTANQKLIEALNENTSTLANIKQAREGTSTPRMVPVQSAGDSVEQQQQQFLKEYLGKLQELSRKSTPNGTPATPTSTATVDNTTTPYGSSVSTSVASSIRLFDLDEKTQTFLSKFKDSMDSFGSYVQRMENIANKLSAFSPRIEMQGRHTVQVNITGDKVWESLEGKMLNLVQGEIDKKMNSLWNKSGGEMGSSGAGGTRLAGRFDAQQM